MTRSRGALKKIFFFPTSSRGSSHAVSHVDCCFLSLKAGDCEVLPLVCVVGEATHISCSRWCVRARVHTRPRMTAMTGVLQRHVARYFMIDCQRDEFFPTCSALRAAAITALGVGCSNGHRYYRGTATDVQMCRLPPSELAVRGKFQAMLQSSKNLGILMG